MSSEKTYIFANQVFLVLHHAPRSNSDGTEPASRLGGMVFQGIPHMADDTCKQPQATFQAQTSGVPALSPRHPRDQGWDLFPSRRENIP